ncbi:unnamed protein product [Linum tenue]|uniref:Alcohol dehydrogenase-like C-terminal domain-containing protein n=1 Tax=Linum tenue TaxID=586396 RepID=A0AAV0QCV2_9ROSI|nr:unnamed protein product [Linum tenue]
MELTNRTIVTRNYIDGAPKESDFEVRSRVVSLSREPAGSVIVRSLYVSIDPYQLTRMKSDSSSQSYSSLEPCSVELMKEKLGFDDAFNYKEEPDLKATLKKYFPEGIDVYFDNVGGEMLEAAVDNMNAFGRVAVCGVISEYTGKGRKAAPDMMDVIFRRITIRGFLAADFMCVFPDFMSAACEHLGSGKMVSLEDISIGLDSIPSAFVGLFDGGNLGKKIVQIAAE